MPFCIPQKIENKNYKQMNTIAGEGTVTKWGKGAPVISALVAITDCLISNCSPMLNHVPEGKLDRMWEMCHQFLDHSIWEKNVTAGAVVGA